ncbi:aggrecan core protein-like protein, partial [Leptotrombidium deliense]
MNYLWPFRYIVVVVEIINICSAIDCKNGWFRFKDKCYWKNDTRVTRDENLRNCEEMSAHLVSIASHEETEFIAQMTGEQYYWLSAYRVHFGSDVYKWTENVPYHA